MHHHAAFHSKHFVFFSSQNSFSKFLGACNDIDIRMIKCLKKERLNRREANRLKEFQRKSKFFEAEY